jgi:tetratricopeptide (TPR) repeat protein
MPKLPFSTKTAAIFRFPSIFRFITEGYLIRGDRRYLKLFVVSFISGFLIIGILLQTTQLMKNMQQLKIAQEERQKILTEIDYLKNLTQKYDGYRDVYFQIATLEYKLGNTEESKKYLKKALDADPNFKAGRVLGARVGI